MGGLPQPPRLLGVAPWPTGGFLMLVHIIADYGHGDLAFAEVVQRLKGYSPTRSRC